MSVTAITTAVRATMKLDSSNGERGNVYAFIMSSHGRRPRRYNHEAALQALAKLDDEERWALIESIVRS
jgi:hypothetical protein